MFRVVPWYVWGHTQNCANDWLFICIRDVAACGSFVRRGGRAVGGRAHTTSAALVAVPLRGCWS